jgi:hypothetical protein
MVLLGIVVAGVAVFAFLKMGGGKVFVAAAGHFGEPLANAITLVDGERRCSGARCLVDVGPGVHEVVVHAEGYAPQLQLVAVHPLEPVAVNFRLERGGSSLKISGQPEGASLVVDGVAAGKVPLQLDLSPGTHRLRFEAEHFFPEDRTLDLGFGATQLADVSLRPMIGKALFDVRTPGADVSLVSGPDRKDHIDVTQPVDLDLSRKWTLEAKKHGYRPLEEPIVWNDEAEKTIVVSLEKTAWLTRARRAALLAAAGSRPATATATSPNSQNSPDVTAPDPLHAAMQHAVERESTKPSTGAAETSPSAAEPNEPCRISFNSIPVSSVFVDNARLGVTPILKLSLKAGTHVAQFVDGETKKIKLFLCKPGELKVVAVSLSH